MSRPFRPNAPTPPANRPAAPQKTAAQPCRKAPAAPPAYRPQQTPKVLQQKPATGTRVNAPPHAAAHTHFPHAQSAVPKAFGVKPPNASQPNQPRASQPNQRAHVGPSRQPQTRSRVLQEKTADAPRAVDTFQRQAPHAHARDARPPQPRVLQPKMAGVLETPRVACGVVQLVRTKSKAKVTRGSETTAIKLVKKISARKDSEGRVSNVRSQVQPGKKVGRKSTTGHKTTDTSGPINQFLRKAKLISNIVRMEGGHCIADVFGGSLCKSNTVPLPHAFNTITYKKQETALKKSLPQHGTVMEVSVEYPNNPLDGFLTTAEQNQLQTLVTATQYAKLEALFSNVPDFMAWEVNNSSGGHDWIEFRDIRKDFWPTGHRPGNMLTPKFIKAVRKL